MLNIKEDIFKKAGNQTVFLSLLWKSMGASNGLVFRILQNIFFYVQERNLYRFAKLCK